MDLLRSRFSFIWGAPLDDGPGAVFDADEVRALSAELLELSRVGASPERFRRVVAEHAGKLVSSLFFFKDELRFGWPRVAEWGVWRL